MEDYMRHGHRSLVLLSLFLAFLLAVATGASAQGGATSAVTGTVVDSSSGVVPGADITAKNNATGTTYTAVSGANGAFNIPAVDPGTYTITVALMGFKTAVLNQVVVSSAAPATVKAVLELGKLEETVVVEAAAQLIQTQSTSVASTVNIKQITNLPLVGRGAFEFVTQRPGVNSSTGSSRDAIVNGLPQGSVNITLDGMSIQDNYAKSWDGMFTRVSPRLDAVEEISMGSAAGSASDASQGSIQVRFVTRSGTNQWKGSVYYYYRDDVLNSNTWFNKKYNVSTAGVQTAKPVTHQDQPGGRIGGPIIKDKAFFFVNYEWVSSPGTSTRTPTIMSPSSEQGIFLYNGGNSSVNLMQLAASKGQTSTIDPLIAKTIAAIRASTSQGTVNATTDPATQQLSWQLATKSKTTYPTVRLDYNLTSKHRISASGTYNHLISDPDTTNTYYVQYPGFPNRGVQDSERYSTQLSMRSTLSTNLVNEARFGMTGGATLFFPENNAGMFSDYGGYALGMSAFKSVANPYSTASNSSREGSTKVLEDTVTWMKGKHSLNFGTSFTQANVWLKNQQFVPTLGMGIVTGDPADSMFVNANFPGASSTDITTAKNLYAVLTGRVSSIGRNARIAEDGTTYNILGESLQKGRHNEVDFFLNDSWRVRPNLTVNAGLRYALLMPFYALNNSYSSADMAAVLGVTGIGPGFEVGSAGSNLGNLFQPGVMTGTPPVFTMLTANTAGFNTDRNNLAPSVGVAWTVGTEKGFLHKILGSPGDSVLRAGYSIAYQRPGTSDFTQVYGGNPGVSIDATRNQTNGNLGTLPVLLRSSDLSAPPTNLTRTYPMSPPSQSTSVYAFDPDIQVPRSQSMTFGIQRAITKTMMVEARYLHTNSWGEWTNSNVWSFRDYNEVNVIENGFANEFRVAQANLQANIAAGRGNTFAYTGVAGTSPLPIFAAFINGVPSSQAGNPSKYTGSGWTNSTLLTYMYPLNPNVLSAASNIRSNSTYKTNGLTAGLPANFFVANPDVSSAYVSTNGRDTKYDGIQLVLTRRFSKGLQLNANYSYGVGEQSTFYSFHKPYVWNEMSYTNSTAGGPVNHMFVTNWVYELPFGQGKPFAGNVGRGMQRLVGNWTFSGTLRLQSGRKVDFGNVNMVGFNKDDLQGFYKLQMVTDPTNQYRTLVYMLPQDIIDNTIKAFSVNATGYSAGAPSGRYFAPANGPSCLETAANGYGDCGARSIVVTGPKVFRTDISIIKEVPIIRQVNFRFEAMIFNLFNNTNFNPVTWSTATGFGPTVLDSYQVTGAVDQSRTMQLAFRVSW
jgi:hypothetical protein